MRQAKTVERIVERTLRGRAEVKPRGGVRGHCFSMQDSPAALRNCFHAQAH